MTRGAFLGVENVASHMREAAAEFDEFLLRSGVMLACKCGVGAVAVALEFAAPASMDEALQAVGGAARVPGKDSDILTCGETG